MPLVNLDQLFTKKLSVGVTGFSRSGKTVFIGSVAQALVTAELWSQRRGQGPLAQFGPMERGQFRSASIRDDIDVHLPQFPFRKVRDSLAAKTARWPEPTTGISRIVLDLDYWAQGWFKRLRTVRVELIDYPGEWLVDLPMLGQTYAAWSEQMLVLAKSPARKPLSQHYFDRLIQISFGQTFDEELAIRLAETWTEYLRQAAKAGLVRNQPGRLLHPDALLHSPVLRLVPLSADLQRSAFGKVMAKRFEEYKKKVIRPFFGNHFKNLDRQIVMLDVLRALEQGPLIFDELVDTLRETLQVFNYGKGGPLSWLGGDKITRLLFAATKADHVTRGDRINLEQLVRRMLALVDDRNELRSQTSSYGVISLASVRATEDRMTIAPPKREILYGQPDDQCEPGQWDPGGLPLDMPPRWEEVCFQFLKFAPPVMPESLNQGYPSINLGKALDFLIGDDLK